MTGVADLAREFADDLARDWRSKARPEQLPPPGDWMTWLILAGRGFGKTRTGAEWVQEVAMSGQVGRIALIAPTAADARDVMIEGDSGLLAIAPKRFRPEYQPALRRLTWPNGAIATAFSAEEPDRLRGPQHGALWGDEAAAWANAQAVWDQAQFGLRLGRHPRSLLTTTPRPIPLIRKLLSREGRDVVITRGKTRDNEANLPPSRVRALYEQHEGTRLGRQELDGEVLTDTPGALWKLEDIDGARLRPDRVPTLVRIVVAIDPAVSTREGSNETGIVAAGADAGGHFYVLEDASGVLTPDGWGRRAVDLYGARRADRIIGEANNGGDLIEATVRNVDTNAAFRKVHASRGKATRAEPVAALYEQGRVHHVGQFSRLEDQLAAFTPDFDRNRAGYSPDRLDALVWAITELMGRGREAEAVLVNPGSVTGMSEYRLERSTSLSSLEYD